MRATDVPRQFRFRHPLVRRAVYAHAGGGWRLAAHGRAVAALAARGASAAAQAHHVEHSARRGDEHAIALLSRAAAKAAPRAPATAARWLQAAVRLVPEAESQPGIGRRVELLGGLADAQRASGRLDACRTTLLQALELVPAEDSAARVRLVTACAAVEHWLGLHAEASARLDAAIADLGAERSAGAVALRVERAVEHLHAMDFEAARAVAAEAHAVAGELGDARALGATGAILTLTAVAGGDVAAAREGVEQAAARLDGLRDSRARGRPRGALVPRLGRDLPRALRRRARAPASRDRDLARDRARRPDRADAARPGARPVRARPHAGGRRRDRRGDRDRARLRQPAVRRVGALGARLGPPARGRPQRGPDPRGGGDRPRARAQPDAALARRAGLDAGARADRRRRARARAGRADRGDRRVRGAARRADGADRRVGGAGRRRAAPRRAGRGGRVGGARPAARGRARPRRAHRAGAARRRGRAARGRRRGWCARGRAHRRRGRRGDRRAARCRAGAAARRPRARRAGRDGGRDARARGGGGRARRGRRAAPARGGGSGAAPARAPRGAPSAPRERARGRGPGAAHRARARDRRARHRAPHQPPDRGRAVPVREDRRDPPAQHLRQARRRLPRRGRARRRARRAASAGPRPRRRAGRGSARRTARARAAGTCA